MAKALNKLDAKTIKNLSYNSSASNKHSDGGGLYLFIHANGSKYWRLDYRRPISQKRNTLALGTYDTVSLKEARLKRDEAKRMIANDVDPAEERNNHRNALKAKLTNTFEKFSDQWLKIRELEGKADRETVRKLNRDILPFIGKIPVTDLTVERLENDVTNSLVERGALESARRVKSIMGMVLKLPFKKRLISYNPAYDISLPKPIKGNHNAIVSESELKMLLQKIWRYHAENPRARLRTELALKLSAYIYQRPNEIRELLWEHVDFENQRLCFRASKTHQEHIVPLSRQAFDILKQLEDMRTTSKFVFPSVKSPHESMSEDTIRQALNRLGYKGRHTAHGFRATARTILGEELEYRIDIIEHQLAHTVRDPNGTAYNRTKFLRRRRELMQLWADYLDTLRQGGDVSVYKPQNESNLISFLKQDVA